MKKIQRLAGLLLALCLCAVLTPTAFAATGTAARSSGSTDLPKMSQQEIVHLLNDSPLTLPDDAFDEAPSISNPYAPGKVKEDVLQAAASRFNALRRIAGLPAVTLDSNLCESAQYGAVLLATSNFSHTPSKPSDMDESFFQAARSATNSSSIAAGTSLVSSVDLWMDDSDGGNIAQLGHRRWQLNPTMGKIGFGYAKNPSSAYRQYATEKVFDQSGAGCDYDFIGWPASGNFPSNLFGGSVAWSVTLNPQAYQQPSQSQLTVTLTRESDGKVWTFSGSNYSASNSGLYFHVDTAGYGVSNCIVFRPDGIQKYEGAYTVKIDGIKASSGGRVVDFEYTVEFFDVNVVAQPTQPAEPTQPTQPTQPAEPTQPTQPTQPAEPTQPTQPTQPAESAQPTQPTQPAEPAQPTQPTQPTQPNKPTYSVPDFKDIPKTHWSYEFVMACAEQKIVNGMGGGFFEPNGTVTYGQFAKMLTTTFYPETVSRFEAQPSAMGQPWYWVYMNAAYSHGLYGRTLVKSSIGWNTGSAGDSLSFLPDEDIKTWANVPMTRYDMAEMVYNTLSRWTDGYYDPAKDVTYLGIDFSTYIPTYMTKLTDSSAIPDSHQTAITACMHVGIIGGMSDGSFAGGESMTRAQACKVLVTLMDAISNVELTPVEGIYQT